MSTREWWHDNAQMNKKKGQPSAATEGGPHFTRLRAKSTIQVGARGSFQSLDGALRAPHVPKALYASRQLVC
jgi:hypothetical protein